MQIHVEPNTQWQELQPMFNAVILHAKEHIVMDEVVIIRRNAIYTWQEGSNHPRHLKLTHMGTVLDDFDSEDSTISTHDVLNLWYPNNEPVKLRSKP
jgi:hypothetical protein